MRRSWILALAGAPLLVGACEPAGGRHAGGTASSDSAAVDTHGWSCGPAALLVVGVASGPNAAARLRTSIEREGLATRAVTSFYDLASCARRVGFEPVGLNVPAEQLQRVPLPAIAYVEPSHFLALMQVDPERVVVVDQGTAEYTLPRAEFDRRFGGYVLCLTQ